MTNYLDNCLSLKVIRTMFTGVALFVGTYCFIILLPSRGSLRSKSSRPEGSLTNEVVPLCPKFPRELMGLCDIALVPALEKDIFNMNPELLPGGSYRPKDCEPRQKTAIIVPYRDRVEHLLIFLRNIHPFLQRQQLDYTLFLIEQAGQGFPFNRGRLLNAGFAEAMKLPDYDCIVFHDVDMLPENDHNLYTCSQQPTLLYSVTSDNGKLQPKHWYYMSGALAILTRHFQALNGYPNLYWGWGFEDDDLSQRVRHRFGSIPRRHRDVGRYVLVKHDPDATNPVNAVAELLAKTALSRAGWDGLSNLNYSVLNLERRALFTWILVDVGRPPARLPNGSLEYLERRL